MAGHFYNLNKHPARIDEWRWDRDEKCIIVSLLHLAKTKGNDPHTYTRPKKKSHERGARESFENNRVLPGDATDTTAVVKVDAERKEDRPVVELGVETLEQRAKGGSTVLQLGAGCQRGPQINQGKRESIILC